MPPPARQGCAAGGPRSLLIRINKPVVGPALRPARGAGIRAPLLEPGHLLRQIKFRAALDLDDPDRAIGGLDEKVGSMVREVAVGLHVVDLEAAR